MLTNDLFFALNKTNLIRYYLLYVQTQSHFYSQNRFIEITLTVVRLQPTLFAFQILRLIVPAFSAEYAISRKIQKYIHTSKKIRKYVLSPNAEILA